jgi:hypothetical protein
MKKLLLAIAALAVAMPVFAGTGGNPSPDKKRAPDTNSHWGGNHSQPAATSASPKTEKPAS